ncbi:Uu.00g022320.m01.CDS01 [Anthostomella pinea]|uniref:Chorismate mutase n=1 Tax=Anthostomella pinea TaxID=933095 RepID=A0AAI8W121_9PEZI|nr:Uu.00g022320.m01.CDS01 [Anthostomella pinea]
MDTIVDLKDASQALDLSNIRFQLIRLEDTITFHLIERVQFPLNKTVYIPGAIELGADKSLSFMDWYLREQEKIQSRIRRYEAPDEYPFFPDALQPPILKPIDYPRILHPNDVNVNEKIKRFYTEKFLPAVCPDFGRGDRGESEENYGSSATADIACLQALSRRIHFGKFVAESKFQSDPEKYTAMIKAGDRDGIGESITNAAVEKQVLHRLGLKAQTYGTDPSSANTEGVGKIKAEAVVSMYKDFVIPITKEVEVEYLMQRLK